MSLFEEALDRMRNFSEEEREQVARVMLPEIDWIEWDHEIERDAPLLIAWADAQIRAGLVSDMTPDEL